MSDCLFCKIAGRNENTVIRIETHHNALKFVYLGLRYRVICITLTLYYNLCSPEFIGFKISVTINTVVSRHFYSLFPIKFYTHM